MAHTDSTATPHLGDHDQDEHPHGCIAGVVYIGHMVEAKDGAEVEIVHAVLCRRCEDEHQRYLAEADRINEQEMWGPRGRPGR
jgi:hypothetical protein